MLKNILMPAALVTALTGGCASMEGKWSLANVDPTAARRDFAFESLTLQEDGTFYGEGRELSATKSVSGTWTFENGVLSLMEHDGERHTYDAELTQSGRKMKLTCHWEGRRLAATLERKQ